MNSFFPYSHFTHFQNTAEVEVGSVSMFMQQVAWGHLVWDTNTMDIYETFAIIFREDWIKEERQREVKDKM